MREIKFRIYDKHNKAWKYFKAGECIFDGIFNTESLTQFTGLYDKNGKEIYEGDIITSASDGPACDGPREIKWDINCFNAPRMSWLYLIIGNIYEKGDEE